MKTRIFEGEGKVLVTATSGSVLVLFEPSERDLLVDMLAHIISDVDIDVETSDAVLELINDLTKKGTIQ